jgi:hypothetical protein
MALTQIQAGMITDIPDASVTTAKIVNGNITTAKIADGNITAAKMGSGSVVGFATGVSSSEISLGSTVNVWCDAFTITITTKRPNSILIVDAVLTVDRTSGNYPAIQTRIHAYKNGVSAGIIQTLQYSEYEGNVQEHHIGRSPIQGWHTSTGIGDVWTYYIQAANQSGSTPSGTYGGYVNRYGGSTGFVLEVTA